MAREKLIDSILAMKEKGKEREVIYGKLSRFLCFLLFFGGDDTSKLFFQNIICYFLLIFLTHVWGQRDERERWRFLGCDDHKSHYTFSGLR